MVYGFLISLGEIPKVLSSIAQRTNICTLTLPGTSRQAWEMLAPWLQWPSGAGPVEDPACGTKSLGPEALGAAGLASTYPGQQLFPQNSGRIGWIFALIGVILQF